jgi:hypothetical protein
MTAKKPRRRSRPHYGFLAVALTICLGLANYLLDHGPMRLPPNTLPWKPVALDAKPTLLAHVQLNELAHDPEACRTALTHSRLVFHVLPDHSSDDACGFSNVVQTDHSPIAFNEDVVATCSLTAALYWYQLRLEDVAQRDLHSTVARIDQLGTYSCRNVDSAKVGPRSQHATANAIDIAAFRLADGRVISVAKDYGKPTQAGHFLDDAHDAACGLFNTVLGPRYDHPHATHFHLDMGPDLICS